MKQKIEQLREEHEKTVSPYKYYASLFGKCLQKPNLIEDCKSREHKLIQASAIHEHTKNRYLDEFELYLDEIKKEFEDNLIMESKLIEAGELKNYSSITTELQQKYNSEVDVFLQQKNKIITETTNIDSLLLSDCEKSGKLICDSLRKAVKNNNKEISRIKQRITDNKTACFSSTRSYLFAQQHAFKGRLDLVDQLSSTNCKLV